MHGNDRRTKSKRLRGILFADPMPDDQDEAPRTRWEPRDPFATSVCSTLPLA